MENSITSALTTIADYLSLNNKFAEIVFPNGKVTFEFKEKSELDIDEIRANDEFGILPK